jgi:predicted deacetylase
MNRGRALLALHDVTPAFETEIRLALGLLRQWRLPPPALAVVPDYHGRWPLANHPDFCAYLANAGSEVLLHGYDHRAPGGVWPEGRVERLKARLVGVEAEFHTLPFGRAVERVERGCDEVERALGTRPEGFVAPGWLEHHDTYRALDTAGLGFHEDHLHVSDLGTLTRHLAPAIFFTTRDLMRTYASVAWAGIAGRLAARPGDVRLVLHPPDFISDRLVAAIGRLVRSIGEGREWVGYRELLAG